MKAEQKSLTSNFELADVFIAEKQYKDAIKELQRIEKNIYDSWSYVGVFKRYYAIGEKEFAEKTIKKALKKNTHNPELQAVYSQFLLRENRLEEAVKISEPLQSTKYGSLYSESVLRFVKAGGNSGDENNVTAKEYYENPNYFNIFLDAYKTSKNPIWIQNCAIFKLEKGDFEEAAALCPQQYANAENAYFWALVLYDSEHYYESISASEISMQYLKGYNNKFNDLKTSDVQLVALESDAYMQISDVNTAEEIRNHIIKNLVESQSLVSQNEVDNHLLPIIITNSAIHKKNISNDDEAISLLLKVVYNWPYYAPALILYSDYAYKTNLPRQEDEETLLLRKAGITSLEMEKYDNRAKIPLSDAIYRIEKGIQEEKNPKLQITLLDLKYKAEKSLSVKEKSADLWTLLENNYSEDKMYEELLVQYALNFLLKTKQNDDAFELFSKFVNKRYVQYVNQNSESKKQKYDIDLWEKLDEVSHTLNIKTLEFAALLAANKELYNIAIDIYEKNIYTGKTKPGEGAISSYASTISCINLGNLYYSIGEREKSLDLYGRAAGRESNKYLRSEIFYRIAAIYSDSADYKNALHAIDYSTSIYPGNPKAQQLKTFVKQKLQ